MPVVAVTILFFPIILAVQSSEARSRCDSDLSLLGHDGGCSAEAFNASLAEASELMATEPGPQTCGPHAVLPTQWYIERLNRPCSHPKSTVARLQMGGSDVWFCEQHVKYRLEQVDLETLQKTLTMSPSPLQKKPTESRLPLATKYAFYADNEASPLAKHGFYPMHAVSDLGYPMYSKGEVSWQADLLIEAYEKLQKKMMSMTHPDIGALHMRLATSRRKTLDVFLPKLYEFIHRTQLALQRQLGRVAVPVHFLFRSSGRNHHSRVHTNATHGAAEFLQHMAEIVSEHRGKSRRARKKLFDTFAPHGNPDFDAKWRELEKKIRSNRVGDTDEIGTIFNAWSALDAPNVEAKPLAFQMLSAKTLDVHSALSRMLRDDALETLRKFEGRSETYTRKRDALASRGDFSSAPVLTYVLDPQAVFFFDSMRVYHGAIPCDKLRREEGGDDRTSIEVRFWVLPVPWTEADSEAAAAVPTHDKPEFDDEDDAGELFGVPEISEAAIGDTMAPQFVPAPVVDFLRAVASRGDAAAEGPGHA